MIQVKRAILALALALGALGQSAFAQEVKISLKNGDILRGLLIVEGDVVVIQPPDPSQAGPGDGRSFTL